MDDVTAFRFIEGVPGCLLPEGHYGSHAYTIPDAIIRNRGEAEVKSEEKAMKKTIRVWDGSKVVCVLSVGQESSCYICSGASGGAENSTQVDIEIDPFKGFIVDHSVKRSPVDFREVE